MMYVIKENTHTIKSSQIKVKQIQPKMINLHEVKSLVVQSFSFLNLRETAVDFSACVRRSMEHNCSFTLWNAILIFLWLCI